MSAAPRKRCHEPLPAFRRKLRRIVRRAKHERPMRRKNRRESHRRRRGDAVRGTACVPPACFGRLKRITGNVSPYDIGEELVPIPEDLDMTPIDPDEVPF
jgi:hypothetical protein